MFPNPEPESYPSLGSIHGAIAEDSWVIFSGLQVIQIVPEEVHSYWQDKYADPGVATCAWQVLDSAWMASFDQQHLANQHHFILVFYDEIVEVVCRELLFGNLPFDLVTAIEANPQLGDAYLRLANALRSQNKPKEAIENYKRYLDCRPDGASAAYARRCLDRLLAEKPADGSA